MNKVDLDKYYKDTFSLARTLIVKIDKIARRDNEVLQRAGYEVDSDPRTWRYYLNLNGQYHEADKPMMVESIDTGEYFLFNKENLSKHLITFKEYLRRDYWYNRLIDTYPDQALLINGILSPIPLETSVGAEDYSILYFDEFLVGWNEDQLIPKLQKHINSLVPQLFNNDYMSTDDMFLPLMIKLLYSDLVKTIHAIRLEDCFTRHTHDFFIWSHIDSFGDFSKYRPNLSNEQTMWLFRNISWLSRNPGKKYTFNKLLDNILTKGNVPLSEYDLVGITENQVEELTPEPSFRRSNLNLLDKYGTVQTFISNDSMSFKQANLAVDNLENLEEYNRDSFEKGRYSLFSEVKTKSLESSMYDSTNSHQDTPMSIVLNSWIYLAYKGYFQSRVVLINPKTSEQFRTDPIDAFHLWNYLLMYARGEKPNAICPTYYQNVMQIPPPSLEEVIHAGHEKYIDIELARDIRDKYVPIQNFYTNDVLISYSNDVYRVMWEHRKQYSQFYDLNKRARVRNATKTMYDSGVCQLGSRTNYDTLLDDYHIEIDTFSNDELRQFAWDIFKRTTGWDSNNQMSLRGKQSDLIELMDKLSSYTIHFLKEITDSSNRDVLVNEFMVGDSRLTGPGHSLVGDFSNVMVDVQSNLHQHNRLGSTRQLVDNPIFKTLATSDGKANIPDKSNLIGVNILSLYNYAVKFPNNSYLRGVILDNPLPDVVVIPPTYYGVLQPEDNRVRIPPTYYGVLQPGMYLNVRIPPTYYGELKPGAYVPVRIPPTYYGPLYPGILEDVRIPPTYYGVLKYSAYGEVRVPTTYYGTLKYGVYGEVPIPPTYYGILNNKFIEATDVSNTYYGELKPLDLSVYVEETYYGKLLAGNYFLESNVIDNTYYGELKAGISYLPESNVKMTYYGKLFPVPEIDNRSQVMVLRPSPNPVKTPIVDMSNHNKPIVTPPNKDK